MDKETLRKITVSKTEEGVGIKGFSRRELAMTMVIAQAVLGEQDIADTLNIESRFKTDGSELDELRDKLTNFLEI